MFLLAYLLCVFPLLVSSVEVISMDVPADEAVKTVERNCELSNNGTDEDLRLLHDLSHLSDTREARCMVACVVESFGTLDELGAPSVEHLDRYLRAQFKPEDHDLVMKIWMESFTAAARENIPDRCDFVFKFVQDFIDKINESKIEKIKFWDV